MSTVVAVSKAGHTVVAWDSLMKACGTWQLEAENKPKVIRCGLSLIGVAGLGVYVNILQDYLQEKDRAFSDEQAVFSFFLEFWKAMHDRYHFVNDVHDTDNECPFADLGSEFVIANASGIFHVQEIMSVTRHSRFCALGSGAPHAEGALAVLYETEKDAQAIAERAVAVALRFDVESGGEVNCLSV